MCVCFFFQNNKKLPFAFFYKWSLSLRLLTPPLPTFTAYCVYYLRKLKVLDGIGVDINEQQSAREKYSGKLTAEFLAEKINLIFSIDFH